LQNTNKFGIKVIMLQHDSQNGHGPEQAAEVVGDAPVTEHIVDERADEAAVERVVQEGAVEYEPEGSPKPRLWGRLALRGRRHARPTASADTFYVQRPIIYSGSSAGFFENPTTLAELEDIQKESRGVAVPHVTIGGARLTRQILAQRPELSVKGAASETRSVFDDPLKDRRYGHVNGAVNLNEYVALTLDEVTRSKLGQDVEALCEHFGIPFNPEDITNNPHTPNGHFFHVTVAVAASAKKAQRIASRLNEFVQVSHDPARPEAKAVGFGMATVLEPRD
jgi:hypothetical protein